MKDSIVIAIDGPSASGKGTCSRYLAEKLGFVLADSGAMYRTLTWYCLDKGIEPTDVPRLIQTVRTWPARLEAQEGEIRLLVDGHFPATDIRSDRVSSNVARISPVAAVRIWMVRTLRECLSFGNVVMDGRDIGTHVFPETPFKFYLTASDEVRAQRRRAQGSTEDTAERDRRDRVRAVAPLEAARDAVVVDNSHPDPRLTAEFMLAHYRARKESLGL